MGDLLPDSKTSGRHVLELPPRAINISYLLMAGVKA
jgi:hypothetical protein